MLKFATFEKQVGLEAEFLTFDKDSQVVLPPFCADRDDFPLLGEIRGKPGATTAATVANFILRKMEMEELLMPTYEMRIQPSARVGLAVYRDAMRACSKPKNETVCGARNVYGTDITGYSDQIIEGGKIQGINASCGLHIHFSCRVVDKVTVKKPKFTPVRLPIATDETTPEGAKSLIRPYLDLYKNEGYEEEGVLEATASLLNRPTVEWMVRELDARFFERFAGHLGDERTKYRQPGFYEWKEHGFEYRSLPASPESLEALQEIVEFAFELLEHASEYA